MGRSPEPQRELEWLALDGRRTGHALCDEQINPNRKSTGPPAPALKNLLPPRLYGSPFGVLRIDARKFARIGRL